MSEYPTSLKEFAYIKPDILTRIADFAVKENWGENLQTLFTYLDYNFEISYEQKLLKFSSDEGYCLWRVGHLVTQDGQPITLLFQKNRIENKQPYIATFVFIGERFDLQIDGNTIREKATKSPKYKIPRYRADYKLQFNFNHYLQDHESRMATILPGLNSYQRFLIVYGAIIAAHRIAAQVAVPQWFRDKNAEAGGYKWLLPLRFHDPDTSQKPDFVAALDPDTESKEYLVRTILPPEWAYGNARAIIANVDSKISNWV